MYICITCFVLLSIPFLRLLYKRISLIIQLHRCCKKCGFKMVTVNPFWLFSGLSTQKCDIHIYSQKVVYSLKLCGSLISKKIAVSFMNARSYAIKNSFFLVLYTSQEPAYKKKTKKPYDFKYKLADAAYSKISCPVLLMCPVSAQVYRTEGTNRVAVGNGDDIGECFFYTKTGFLERLKNDSLDSACRE